MKWNKIFVLFILTIFLSSNISAGVGLKWEQESKVVKEGEKTCMTYNVYNPWPEEEYVRIGLSQELSNVLIAQNRDSINIPAETSSQNAIPVEFCFETPQNVYEKNCLFGSWLVCERKCSSEQKVYEGSVVVSSVPGPTQLGGTGGSAATMSVSAPLRLRVACQEFDKDYTFVYLLIALVALAGFIWAYKSRHSEKNSTKKLVSKKKRR